MRSYTHQEISVDSIIERVMTFAPLYEQIVQGYRGKPIYKSRMDIQKKNLFSVMCLLLFRLQKGFAISA